MEHPFSWHNLLPEGWQHSIGDHTFFAIISAILLILFALKARGALVKSRILWCASRAGHA